MGVELQLIVATHDAPIVDSLQRRVVAVVAGEVVRDDAVGAYRVVTALVEEPVSCV